MTGRGVAAEVWAADTADVRLLTVWSERRAGRGEDAEPLALLHRPTGRGLLAVFDGAGGAGAASAWGAYTGAWVGARVARLATEAWFRHAVGIAGRVPESGPGGGSTLAGAAPPAGDALARVVRHALRAASPASRSKLTGSMRRALPTTLAAVSYRAAEGAVRCQALWAGDSRAYVLLPGTGLHALTRDHTAEDDALDQLRQDPPMTNLLSADRPFTVAAHPARGPGAFPLPCVLLAATDGFSGYVRTPAHFEWVLLDALMRARDTAGWAAGLREAVRGYTADDASLSLAAFGFADFPRLREAYRGRHESVRRRYMTGAPQDDRGWQDDAWAAYRPGYERYMPPPDGDGDGAGGGTAARMPAGGGPA
jgi:serine/threonine protein phosphatase PrpC